MVHEYNVFMQIDPNYFVETAFEHVFQHDKL